jgi:hypothetical protein
MSIHYKKFTDCSTPIDQIVRSLYPIIQHSGYKWIFENLSSDISKTRGNVLAKAYKFHTTQTISINGIENVVRGGDVIVCRRHIKIEGIYDASNYNCIYIPSSNSIESRVFTMKESLLSNPLSSNYRMLDYLIKTQKV